jgi:hypothetical protein
MPTQESAKPRRARKAASGTEATKPTPRRTRKQQVEATPVKTTRTRKAQATPVEPAKKATGVSIHRVAEAEVVAWIKRYQKSNPTVKPSPALEAFRAEGKSCNGGRWRALYRAQAASSWRPTNPPSQRRSSRRSNA